MSCDFGSEQVSQTYFLHIAKTYLLKNTFVDEGNNNVPDVAHHKLRPPVGPAVA